MHRKNSPPKSREKDNSEIYAIIFELMNEITFVLRRIVQKTFGPTHNKNPQ